MKHYESRIQMHCVQWFRTQYPDLWMNLFAVPNGGARGAITAKILKAEGVVAGVSDLILLVPNREHPGLCIEMKYGDNRQTKTQKMFQIAVTRYQYKYVVCKSLEQFIDEINTYLRNK